MGVAGVAPLDDGALSTQLGTDVFLHGRYMEVGVHGSGSLGTATGAPSGFVGTTGVFYPWSGGVGLITDFGQDGFDVGVPTPFSGDYFLPGEAVEGWTMAYQTAAGDTVRNQCMGTFLQDNCPTPSVVQDISAGSLLGSVWVGVSGPLALSKVLWFGVNDTVLHASVVIENRGPSPVRTLDYLRTINADQEYPWLHQFLTRNYVTYQRFVPSDVEDRSNAAVPNACQVVAEGARFPDLVLGVSSVHPNCRTYSSGFSAPDDLTAAWNSPTWSTTSSSNKPRSNDAVHMHFRVEGLAPGATLALNWAYSTTVASTQAALTPTPVEVLAAGERLSSTRLLFAVRAWPGSATGITFAVLQGGGSGAALHMAPALLFANALGLGVYVAEMDTASLPTGAGYVFVVEGAGSEGGAPVLAAPVGPFLQPFDVPAPWGVHVGLEVLPAALDPRVLLLLGVPCSVTVTLSTPVGLSPVNVASVALVLSVNGQPAQTVATLTPPSLTASLPVDALGLVVNDTVVLTALTFDAAGVLVGKRMALGVVDVMSPPPPPPISPQVRALQDMYVSMGGPMWVQQTNWNNASVSVCQWFGVSCVGGAVVAIRLPSNRCVGTLPISVSALGSLISLQLENNTLTSTIPTTFSFVSNLRILNLKNNNFTGDLDTLAHLPRLTDVLVDSNRFTGTLPNLTAAAFSLRYLNLASNSLTGPVADYLGQLTSLTFLRLSLNKLSGTLPASLGGLSSLRQLYVSYMGGVTGPLPLSLFQLSTLKTLSITTTGVGGPLPSQITFLSRLEELDMSSNKLDGPCPDIDGYLPNLRTINLRFNYFNTSLPQAWLTKANGATAFAQNCLDNVASQRTTGCPYASRSPTRSPSRSPSPSRTPPRTPSRTLSSSPTPVSRSPSASRTCSSTLSRVPGSASPSPTRTVSPRRSGVSSSPAATQSASPSPPPSSSRAATRSASPSPSSSPSRSATLSPSPSATPTPSASPAVSSTPVAPGPRATLLAPTGLQVGSMVDVAVAVTGVDAAISVVVVVQAGPGTAATRGSSTAGSVYDGQPPLVTVMADTTYESLTAGGSVVLLLTRLNCTELAKVAPPGTDSYRVHAVVMASPPSDLVLVRSLVTTFRVQTPQAADIAFTVVVGPPLAAPVLLPADAPSNVTVVLAQTAAASTRGAQRSLASTAGALGVGVTLVSDLGQAVFSATGSPGAALALPQAVLSTLVRRAVCLLVVLTSAGGDVLASRALCGGVGWVAPNQKAEERTALLAMYDSLRGANSSLGWPASAASGVNPCSWARVLCNTGGLVTDLRLTSLNLSGTLPPDVSVLKSLTSLQLTSNLVSGTLPRTIGALTALQSLVLRANAMSGRLDALSSLERIGLIVADGNSFVGDLSWTTNLTSLKSLNLASNQLSGPVLDGLARLTALTFLRLSYNKFTGSIPASLGALASLSQLYISYMPGINGTLPLPLFRLPSLRTLSITVTSVTGTLPSDIKSLTALEVLDLSFNKMAGPVPDVSSALPNLRNVTLRANFFSGTLPPSWLPHASNSTSFFDDNCFLNMPNQRTSGCA